MDWEDVEDEEPKDTPVMRITLPPPPASPDAESVVDIMGFCAVRAAQETTRVENIKLRRELEEAQINNTLMSMGRDQAERELFRLGAWPYGYHEEAVVARAIGVRPSEAIEVLAMYGESQPPMPTMLPRRVRRTNSPRRSRRAVVERLIADRMTEAITEHERNRTNPANAGGTANVQSCSHKTFMNGKPHPFNGTEGVVGLRLE
ncbi:hypothetical protein Tco_0273397 [Tanacetum coccineum]